MRLVKNPGTPQGLTWGGVQVERGIPGGVYHGEIFFLLKKTGEKKELGRGRPHLSGRVASEITAVSC